ncbi:Homeobox-leucine zipper protein ROC8 [Hordeum vulgare]|nr:Homeobox-leucine zipper protein ROC8 [Hordeum vulgare]
MPPCIPTQECHVGRSCNAPTLRAELSREPHKVKYWFQNRRTQMKTKQERQDNDFLRTENDEILCENIALRHALQNAVCPSCEPTRHRGLLRRAEAPHEERSASPISPSAARSVSPLNLFMGAVQLGGHHQPFGGASLSLDLDLSRAGMSEGCGQEDWGAHFSTYRQ